MSRIERRNFGEEFLKLVSKGGFLHLIDNSMKITYRINDEELDLLCEKCTEEELDDLINDESSFTLKRRKINILKKYL